MVEALTLARMEIGVSRRELAALAGVPQSTISRIENGEVSPSAATLNRILAAVGRRTEILLEDVVDMSAVAACRAILDPDSALGDTEGTERWIQRWQRAGMITPERRAVNPARLAQIAAANARIASRPAQQQFSPRSATETARILTDAGVGYSLTGSAAANRILPTASEPWTIVYVDDLAAASELFGPTVGRYNPKMTAIARTRTTRTGTWIASDGVAVADPIQVLIDLYAGTDRMPDQADLLAAYFDRQAMNV